jgi:hypothetical protein
MKSLLRSPGCPCFRWLIASLLCASSIAAAETDPAPALTGIVNLPDLKLALLEAASPRPGPSVGLILAPGEREGNVRVISVHPEAGAIQLGSRISTNLFSLRFQDATRHLEPGRFGLLFEHAPINQALMVYQQLAGRTLLVHPSLPPVSFSLNATVTNRTEAARVLEKEFAAQGITTVPDGGKFTMLVPKSQLAAARPRSSEIRPASPPAGKGNTNESIPPGVIHFQGISPDQAAAIYAELLGRKLDRTTPLPPTTTALLQIKTETPLSREEAQYALEVLFAWQGFKLVPSGDEFLKPVAIPESER